MNHTDRSATPGATRAFVLAAALLAVSALLVLLFLPGCESMKAFASSPAAAPGGAVDAAAAAVAAGVPAPIGPAIGLAVGLVMSALRMWKERRDA